MIPRPRSIRARLALWHTAILALMLVAFGAATYVLLGGYLAARTDTALADIAGAVRTSLVAEWHEERDYGKAAAAALDAFRFRDIAVAVIGPGGRAWMSVGRAPSDVGREAAAGLTRLASRTVPDSGFRTVRDSEGGIRTYALPAMLAGQRYTVLVAESLHQARELQENALVFLLAAIPLALLLAWMGGWFLATRSLAPVVLMSDRAARIGAANARERLPVANPDDELGHLARVFNALLERLGTALEQQRRFMADASHELRTPVAVVRAEADVSMAREHRDEEEYREALRVVRVEAERLSVLVDDLFLLARVDAGEYPVRASELYLEEVVLEEARALRAVAARRGISIACTVPEEARFWGDEALLRRMLRNLLDNAIKHGPARHPVELALRSDLGGYLLTVRDHGPGIPAEAQERIFERFYRLDVSRSRPERDTATGAGLGLAIARWIVQAHGGSLTVVSPVESAGDGAHGTEFRVWLPIRTASAGECTPRPGGGQ